MLIKKVLEAARLSLFPARKAQPPTSQDHATGAPIVDGNSILRLGDTLFDSNRLEEAEATYRRALGSDAPSDLVTMKLQRVVAKIARKFDAPGSLLVAPGDGTATAPDIAQFYSLLDAINRDLATVPAVMPSKFWVSHANQHVEFLVKFGLINFKRTVAHNYYNGLTLNLQDKQIRRLLENAQVAVAPMDDTTATLAIQAFQTFGKGRGHPAQLNMGDCFSHACATQHKLPLLYVGDDFAQTDLG